jgi:hypothetical protein
MGLWSTQGNEKRPLSSNRSPWKLRPPLCHPACPGLPWDRKRTRISYLAALTIATHAAFRRERRTELTNATKFHRKSGGA